MTAAPDSAPSSVAIRSASCSRCARARSAWIQVAHRAVGGLGVVVGLRDASLAVASFAFAAARSGASGIGGSATTCRHTGHASPSTRCGRRVAARSAVRAASTSASACTSRGGPVARPWLAGKAATVLACSASAAASIAALRRRESANCARSACRSSSRRRSLASPAAARSLRSASSRSSAAATRAGAEGEAVRAAVAAPAMSAVSPGPRPGSTSQDRSRGYAARTARSSAWRGLVQGRYF